MPIYVSQRLPFAVIIYIETYSIQPILIATFVDRVNKMNKIVLTIGIYIHSSRPILLNRGQYADSEFAYVFLIFLTPSTPRRSKGFGLFL